MAALAFLVAKRPGCVSLSAIVIEDGPDFISNQLVLAMEFVDEEGEGPFSMKHWRQDWRYEDHRGASLGAFFGFGGGRRELPAGGPAPALTVVVLLAFLLACRAAAPEHTYQVVKVFPHDTSAFTQGLVYEDGQLIESTGRYGASTLRRVELETGGVLASVPLQSSYFGEGTTVLGDTIYQLTWREETAFVYDAASFEVTGTFSYPTEGWGLTHNGSELIMSDGSQDLYFRDPDTFAELRRVEVTDGGAPVIRLNELEYINGEVWANQWLTDRIARIDPVTGEVMAWVDLSGIIDPEPGDPNAVLNGIAYDAATGRLFVTGKYWPWLYEIRVHPRGGPPPPARLVIERAPGGPGLWFSTFRGFRYQVRTSAGGSFPAWTSWGDLHDGTGYEAPVDGAWGDGGRLFQVLTLPAE